mmetsp:Transcript_62829/g.71129  ORF Transcript_62829/g.71129 Transcript_62829/m.71129 type:complete len:94 (+) Transcript_62829:291-572(+)
MNSTRTSNNRRKQLLPFLQRQLVHHRHESINQYCRVCVCELGERRKGYTHAHTSHMTHVVTSGKTKTSGTDRHTYLCIEYTLMICCREVNHRT